MIARAATNGKAKVQRVPVVRCAAIYTRKSTDEGLDKDFNSLDAQYEACASYIESQRHDGWSLLPERFDDGGYTGANDRRPGLQSLLALIDAGRVQVVVVHRIDRLSRSLADFVRLMAMFEDKGVAFVSVTQQFSTGTPVGRLTLNLLSCFAEFEREMISERTRDKIHAARKRGKWTGGPPPLGYDVAPEGGKIVVNESEAKQVRAIFNLYLKVGTLTGTAKALNQKGWTTKAWTTRDGNERPGRRFTKSNLRALLSNPINIGKTRLNGEVYDGDHDAIVKPAIFDKVQALLADNAPTGTGSRRRRSGSALLAKLLRCGPCDASMGVTHTTKRERRYRYYICRTTRTDGYGACPTKSVPAAEIERLVVEQIRAIGKDEGLLAQVLEAARSQAPTVDEADLRRALALFDPVWDALHAKEQARVLTLLIERVDYDGDAGTVEIAFRATGIQALAEEVQP